MSAACFEYYSYYLTPFYCVINVSVTLERQVRQNCISGLYKLETIVNEGYDKVSLEGPLNLIVKKFGQKLVNKIQGRLFFQN